MKKITVLLVDDHTVVRQGLRALLRAEEDIEVIGEAENGRLAVQLVRKTPPDVVVMDVAMPLMNGLEATRQILKNSPGTRILVLTSAKSRRGTRFSVRRSPNVCGINAAKPLPTGNR
jgi:DNA-binding NarL/FixJ family response regulator